MADFEEKLNAILSSPESMQQVAKLAQILSSQSEDTVAPPSSSADAPSETTSQNLSGISSLLGSIDLNTVSRFLPLLQELNHNQNDERAQLLHALKPFLKPERREKVDTALRLAHLLHVGKTFFKGFGESHV